MTLEESIKGVSGVICGWFANGAVGTPNEELLKHALRQFAEAISAKASEGREKPEEIPAWKCDCGRVFTCDGYHSHKKYMASINQHCEKPPEPLPCVGCGMTLRWPIEIENHKCPTHKTDELPEVICKEIQSIADGVAQSPNGSPVDKFCNMSRILRNFARLCLTIASRGKG